MRKNCLPRIKGGKVFIALKAGLSQLDGIIRGKGKGTKVSVLYSMNF